LRTCYLDASALVKLATPEAETDALRAALGTFDARVTNRLATVEVARALLRRGVGTAALVADVPQAFSGLAFTELDPAIAESAGRLGPPALRSLDAIHLASALALGAELDALVTYDGRLADAARAAGLEVIAPA
jgi:predicted nucleic acid-binding protein